MSKKKVVEPEIKEVLQDPLQHYERIDVERIALSGLNPRKEFNKDAMEELKSSIREHGILEPLIVRPVGSKNDARYELVAGERRMRAAQELGIKDVPCVVRDLDDKRARELRLLENLQREDLAPMEIAQGLQDVLSADSELTQEELAKKLGKSQGWISNHLRLLKAPADLQELLISGRITPKHAVHLLPYTEYPVYESIMEELKEGLEDEGKVSVEWLQETVQHEVTHNWSGTDNTLDLDAFPYEKRRFQELFDRTGCDKCKDKVKMTVSGYGQPHNFCLKPDCYLPRLQKAAEELEAEKQKIKESAMEAPKIKASVMDLFEYGEYERMEYVPFDMNKAGCPTCPKLKTTTKKEKICLDPKCYRNKKTQHTKAVNKNTKNMKTQAFEAIEAYCQSRSGPLNVKELRMVLDTLADMVQLANSGFRNSLKRWTDDFGHYHIEEITCKVPDQDIPTALLSICLMRSLEKTSHTDDYDKLKQRVEDFSQPGDSLDYIRKILGREPEEDEEDEEEAGEGFACSNDKTDVFFGDLEGAKEYFNCEACNSCEDGQPQPYSEKEEAQEEGSNA